MVGVRVLAAEADQVRPQKRPRRLPLWSQPVYVAGEEGGFFDVVEADDFFDQALQAHAEAAVGRYAVAESLEEVFEAGVIRRAAGLLFELGDQHVVAVLAHTAGGDFYAAEEQVEALGRSWVVVFDFVVKLGFTGRPVGHKNRFAAQLFRGVITYPALFVRAQIFFADGIGTGGG